MKIPSGSLDANGKTAKGEVILTVGEDQVALQEFGTTTEGNKTSCYVLTSRGDIPTMRFALNASIADHVDLVVDGVLRNCQSTPFSKTFKGTFEKALYQGMKTKSKRGAVKYSKMQVKDRINIDDMISTNSSAPSPVGSFELRLYRADPETSEEAKPSESEPPVVDCVDRPPAYDKCAEWYDCNSNLNFEGPRPPFQIE
ncbi:hypothetical protein DL98DRAFT_256432 [Cadophora sp. DSE1049]|nr:hypothetical protein DL98DRAFT_256432 [Cadophora sp. DSE1049]